MSTTRSDTSSSMDHTGTGELKTLSVVIPVFNERATLVEIIRRVLAADISLAIQIILVDDFSTDGTRSVYPTLEATFPDADIQTHYHEHNQGKGAALRTGFAAATGDIVLIQDADLEYSPADYPRLLDSILSGQADVVYGSRFAGGQAHRVLFFWHMIGNKILTMLSNAMTNLNLTDMETCYKVFRREVLDGIHIQSNRFGFEPEITAKIARGDWRIYEVGITYHGRSYAEGKKITWRDGVRALWTILRFNLFA